MAQIRIGTLARRTGTNAPTIRYYEEIGLLPRAHRHSGGQRTYDAEDVTRLTFIRRCRDFGLSIEQVRSLLALAQDRERSCFTRATSRVTIWQRCDRSLRSLRDSSEVLRRLLRTAIPYVRVVPEPIA